MLLKHQPGFAYVAQLSRSPSNSEICGRQHESSLGRMQHNQGHKLILVPGSVVGEAVTAVMAALTAAAAAAAAASSFDSSPSRLSWLSSLCSSLLASGIFVGTGAELAAFSAAMAFSAAWLYSTLQNVSRYTGSHEKRVGQWCTAAPSRSLPRIHKCLNSSIVCYAVWFMWNLATQLTVPVEAFKASEQDCRAAPCLLRTFVLHSVRSKEHLPESLERCLILCSAPVHPRARTQYLTSCLTNGVTHVVIQRQTQSASSNLLAHSHAFLKPKSPTRAERAECTQRNPRLAPTRRRLHQL